MEKAKHAPRPFGSVPFVLIWVAAHILGWFTLYTAYDIFYELNDLPDWMQGVVFGAVLFATIVYVQKRLIQRKFTIRLDGWMRLSAVGWLVGGLLLGVLILSNSDLSIYLGIAALFVPPAIAQWWLLRGRLRGAWVWILAGAVSAFAFVNIIEVYGEGDGFFPFFAIAAALQGAVTAASLIWLFYQSRDDKRKAMASD